MRRRRPNNRNLSNRRNLPRVQQQPQQVPVEQPQQVPVEQPQQVPGGQPQQVPGGQPQQVPVEQPQQVPGGQQQLVPEDQHQQVPGGQQQLVPEDQHQQAYQQQQVLISLPNVQLPFNLNHQRETFRKTIQTLLAATTLNMRSIEAVIDPMHERNLVVEEQAIAPINPRKRRRKVPSKKEGLMCCLDIFKLIIRLPPWKNPLKRCVFELSAEALPYFTYLVHSFRNGKYINLVPILMLNTKLIEY